MFSPDIQAKVKQARDATNAEIEKALTDEQRTIWLAAVKAKASQRGFGPGGRGGGMGGGGRGGGMGGGGGGGGGFGGGGGGR
jgi:hypothetical protein